MTGSLQAVFQNQRSFAVAPVNTVAPAVTGTATFGYTLSSSTGTWTGSPSPTFTYQWQRVTTNISAATSSTYVLVTADVGSTIRCVVTATNSTSAVSANSNSTSAVSDVYALWSCGIATYGQLGRGNTTSYSSPQQVGSLEDWYSVGGCFDFVCAVKTNGTLWSWGRNSSGTLGLGNTTNYSSPKQVGALTNWSKVFAPSYAVNNMFALKTDGTLWGWGTNGTGRLGLGNTTAYNSPKAIGALTNWSKVVGNNRQQLALKTDGTLWVWSANIYGQLGLGNTTNYSSPKQLGALTTWTEIIAGFEHSLGVKGGELWSWGRNQTYGGYAAPPGVGGQLGLGNSTNYSSPKQVGALTTWSTGASADGAQEVGNAGNSMVIKTDGTLWVFGGSSRGCNGLGNTTLFSSPVQVGALTNWRSVRGNTGNSGAVVAFKTDGTLFTWGGGAGGQLGLGNLTTYSSPKQVGALTTWKGATIGAMLQATK